MERKKLISDYTAGPIGTQLIVFMLPFMASNGLQVLYNLVDMVIVGRFVGPAGLTGVSQGGVMINFASLFCMGFATSGQIMIAQLIGAGRRDALRQVIGTLFTVMFVLGAVLTGVLVSLRGTIVSVLRVGQEAVEMTGTYLLICGGGLLFTCGYNTVSTILRGMGDSRHPFIFITSASVLNLLLDLLLTGALGLGVAGAAFATVFSQGVSFVCSVWFLSRRKEQFYFDFRPASFRPEAPVLVRMLRLGVPFALQSCAINISMMICNSFINRLGVAASATFGVGTKIDDIAGKLAMGVQQAAAPMIAQNFGARKFERVRSVLWWTWGLCAGVFLLFFLSYMFFGRDIFSLFTNDASVAALAPVFISAICWSFPGMVLMRGTNSLLQGIGNSRLIFLFSVIDGGLRAVLSYLFGIVMGLGFYGFTLGFALAPYGISLPAVVYFFLGGWEKRADVNAPQKV